MVNNDYLNSAYRIVINDIRELKNSHDEGEAEICYEAARERLRKFYDLVVQKLVDDEKERGEHI